MLLWLVVVAGQANTLVPGIPVLDMSNMKQQDVLTITPLVQYYSGEESIGLEHVLQMPEQYWKANQAGVLNFGQTAEVYWLRFRLQGIHSGDFRWLMRLGYPHLDQLDVYYLSEHAKSKGDVIEHIATGDTVPFSKRAVDDRNFIFPLDEFSRDNVEVYIRLQSEGPLQVPLVLMTKDAFELHERNEAYWLGAYFGIMCIMFFYNLFVFIVVRERTYAFYLFYLVSVTGLQYVLQGYGFKWIWPESTTLNNFMVMVFAALTPLSAILFVMHFLDIRSIGTVWENRLIKGFVWSFGGLFLASLVLNYATWLMLSQIMSFASIGLAMYVGITYWRRGVRAAKIFTIAWSIYLFFVLIYLLELSAVIQTNMIVSHALEFGSATELVLLSLAFGYRINEEKEARIRAQEQALEAQRRLNQDLDEQVRERTHELENLNQRLHELSIRDGLTGLFNRRHFDETLEQEFQRAFREKNWLTMIMLDVDHFKQVNDRFGHPFGDRCLQAIAGELQTIIHRSPDMVARYGGEEFSMLLPGTDLSGGKVVAESVREAITHIKLDCNGGDVHLSVSLGVASLVPRSREDLALLVHRADENLYQAKQNGRNQVSSKAS